MVLDGGGGGGGDDMIEVEETLFSEVERPWDSMIFTAFDFNISMHSVKLFKFSLPHL